MPTNPANPNLEKIIKVTQAQYAILEGGGTVGDYTGLNDNYLYLIQDDADVVTSVNNILPVNGNVTLSIPPTVSGTNDGTNWTTITIGGTTKNIPSGGGGSGTVTSVSAGTGLSISGTATVNPTVEIDSNYKLPTTNEWSSKSTVNGSISGTNWSAISIDGTTKLIPQGTVTSARVQAGTGLSSSQSTAQSTTLNTTISIASGYKLPTTSEWNALQTETFRNYGVSSTSPYFKLYAGDGTLVKSITLDISAAYNPNSPNWGILYEYFRETIFNMGYYAENIDGSFIASGPLSCAGLFIADNDFDNNIGPQITENTKWMSDNLLSYFTLAVPRDYIDSFKVEALGVGASLAECTLKITLYTKDTQEYSLQITSLWNGSNNVYWTDGWHISGGSGTKLQTTAEWQNSSLYSAVSGFNTSVGCATSGFYKSTLWSLDDISGITEPYNGMKIVVRIPVAGVGTAGALLSIDDGANYHPIAYNLNTAFTTHYPVNTNKVFVYNATQTMTGYLTMNAVNSKPSDWSSNYKLYYRRPKSNTHSYAWVPNTSTTWDSTNYDYAKGNTSTTFTGVWQGESNYDSNTTVTYGTLAYYFRPYAAQAIYRYKLVALDHDNRLVPISTTNLSETVYADYASSTTYAKDVVVHRYASSVSKWYKSLAASNKGHAPESSPTWWSEVTPNTPTSLAFRPDKIYWYNTTTTINASAAIGGNTLVSVGYNYPYMAYCNFNEGILAYRVFYLCGTYNKTTGLFTLRDGGTAGSKLYYTTAPTNTANLTLSNYFTSGYDYILVGGSYSSNNYTHIREDHPMFHFDGTNLVPWDTWNVNQENTTKYNTSDTTKAQNIRILTQSEYNNLGTKDSNTIYLIKAS